MSTDLNMEYQEVKFGEIANHISKRVEPSETTLEVYVGLEHLDPDSLKITRHGVPSDVAGQKLLVKKGQIIFGKRRAYQRKVAVADWDCICSAHAMVLEAIPGKILPDFLPFFMQSNQFMERAVDISEGSLSPTIKWKILEQQKFQIPTVESQIVLLKKLTLLEQITEKAWASIYAWENLINVFRNKLILKIDDPCVHTKDLVPFSSVVEINPSYKITKKIVPFCDMAALSVDSYKINGEIIQREAKTSGSKFSQGDVLVARITPCAENGKMGIVDFLDENQIGKGSTEFIVIKPKLISSLLAFNYLKAKKVSDYLIGKMEGSTGRQRIPAYVLNDLYIHKDILKDNVKITHFLKNSYEVHEALKSKLLRIQSLKLSLLN